MRIGKNFDPRAFLSLILASLLSSCLGAVELPKNSLLPQTSPPPLPFSTVKVSASGLITVSPSGDQTVQTASTQSFTLSAASGYRVSSAVLGTCPGGSWSGGTYTTGVISNDCSVRFEVSKVSGGQGSIVSGFRHSCALVNGGVQCWGSNEFGQLGNADLPLTSSATPSYVTGLESGVQAIAAGDYHTCAIRDGVAYCWGLNSFGQLGNRSITNSKIPVTVASSLPLGVQAIALGGLHSCAISRGSVYCWGANQFGQLGNNTQIKATVPVPVSRIGATASSIALGSSHSCAVAQGAALCWGYNVSGQVGDGSATNRLTPVAVSGLTSGVSMISAGFAHSCALVSGAPRCWGSNQHGELGNNSSALQSLTPVTLFGMTSGVTSISSGSYSNCLILQGGLKCWGLNTFGQLGNNSSVSSASPVSVTNLGVGVQAVAVGGLHSCALQNGSLKCFGQGQYGQIGNQSAGLSNPTPVQVTGLDRGIQGLALGRNHSCALRDGGLQCWGTNTYGQLGIGSSINSPIPVSVFGLGSGVQAVAAGSIASCALINGGVQCWGYGLGSSSSPVLISGLSSGVEAIAVGESHACVIQTHPSIPNLHAVKCWGGNPNGQLGTGSFTDSATPVLALVSTNIQGIALGANHSCALTDGKVYCWGANDQGQLGDPAVNDDSNTPLQVSGLPQGVQAIAAGDNHTCALAGGGVWCWGGNTNGQLGDNTTTNANAAVSVLGINEGAQALSLGENHSCALVNGGVRCWGSNQFGQLGTGTNTESHVPVFVNGITSGAQMVSSGGSHTCALVQGNLRCWGLNQGGQLGNNSYTNSLIPAYSFGF